MNEQSVKTCLGCGKTKPLSSYWKNGRYGMHPRCKECMGYQGPKSEDEQKDRLKRRFWSKVDKDGPVVREELGPCWVWTGSKHKFGYGYFRFRGKTEYAHRVGWFLEHGEMPSKFICHRCDNGSCVRADHLFEGTAGDNSRDMVEKDRHSKHQRPRGEDHSQAVLLPDEVQAIRKMRANGMSRRSIASKFGISDTHVTRIVGRKNWKHLTGDEE